MDRREVEEFAALLERTGYKNALDLIKDELTPLAKENSISLWDAAWEYADQDEEQDTSWFQLFHALQGIPKNSF